MVTERLIFATMADLDELQKEVLLLTRSIRAFAGGLSQNQIWIMVPEQYSNSLSQDLLQQYEPLNVLLIPFAVDPDALKFPLAAKVYAAGSAEELADDRAGILSWMDSTSIFFRQPDAFLLKEDISLGYRPVDHTLIGSQIHTPLDAFWSQIYRTCGVPAERVFPMHTAADENILRPYFNAGLLVVRPEVGLLRLWRKNFDASYLTPPFPDFYRQDERYEIFMHQAVLSGTILSCLPTDALHLFNQDVNYPLHMHTEIPLQRRPASLNELISGRYCTAYNPDWLGDFLIEEPLKGWLDEQANLI